MALPSYVRITRNGVTYEDGADRASYCIEELTRAAMRDVGKLVIRRARERYYQLFNKITGNAKRAIQYWVPKRDAEGNAVRVAELYVGYKRGRVKGFYAAFQELGTSHQGAHKLLYNVVNDNLDEIRNIEAAYLSAINDNDDGESLIDENDEGGEDSD